MLHWLLRGFVCGDFGAYFQSALLIGTLYLLYDILDRRFDYKYVYDEQLPTASPMLIGLSREIGTLRD